ncbi:MAG TPA: hypothetical protein VFN42_01535 [Acetobacteraceae bacterium]|nr:hypothetical protein [Acetobacteraceae bacterium]
MKRFSYSGEDTPDNQRAFPQKTSDALKSSDEELAKGGLTISAMTLVAPDFLKAMTATS